MLVLLRKRLESVVVGGIVGFERLLKVTVLEFNGGSVRLGFEVDPSGPVHREEIWQRIHGTGKPDSPREDPLAPMVCSAPESPDGDLKP
jgi:carbon storage regulator